jgi:hypothetical protein
LFNAGLKLAEHEYFVDGGSSLICSVSISLRTVSKKCLITSVVNGGGYGGDTSSVGIAIEQISACVAAENFLGEAMSGTTPGPFNRMMETHAHARQAASQGA